MYNILLNMDSDIYTDEQLLTEALTELKTIMHFFKDTDEPITAKLIVNDQTSEGVKRDFLYLTTAFHNETEFVHPSIFHGNQISVMEMVNADPLKYLASAVREMIGKDYIYNCKMWQSSKMCRLINHIAVELHVPILTLT